MIVLLYHKYTIRLIFYWEISVKNWLVVILLFNYKSTLKLKWKMWKWANQITVLVVHSIKLCHVAVIPKTMSDTNKNRLI